MVYMFDNTRVAKHNRMRRNITIHITIGGNQHIISDCNLADNGCVNANPHLVTDGWYPLARATILLPNGNTLMNIDISS